MRDLLIAAVAAGAIWREPEGGLPFTILGGVLLVVVAFFAHEWGHLLGARLGGAVVRPPTTLWSPFLFFFDLERSDTRAFLWMSYGGYFASVAGLLALFAPLLFITPPLSLTIAQGLALVGVLVTIAVEMPATLRAHHGELPSRGLAYTSVDP